MICLLHYRYITENYFELANDLNFFWARTTYRLNKSIAHGIEASEMLECCSQ